MKKSIIFMGLVLLTSCASKSDFDKLSDKVSALSSRVEAFQSEQLVVNDALKNEDLKQNHNNEFVENEIDKINKRFDSLESKLDRAFARTMMK